MATQSRDALIGGELNSAIARNVVRARKKFTGRGPQTAQCFYRDNIIVVMLREVMTSLERSLASRGRVRTVFEGRAQLRGVMEPDLVAMIESMTGGKVVASMGGDHIDPDLAMALFVLDRPVARSLTTPMPATREAAAP
jgi:uncharacterized protein YbcI